MQQALHLRAGVPASPPDPGNRIDSPTTGKCNQPAGKLRTLVSENAVLVFGKQGCCMCLVMKRLLLGHGVNPAVYEVDEEEEDVVEEELAEISGDCQLLLPVVFIGGRFVGGLDRLMAVHISGDLIPTLKRAGALWL